MAARYSVLTKIIRVQGWTRGAELGVCDGQTHLYLLKNCPNLSLIGVDLWDEFTEMRGSAPTEKCTCPHCERSRKLRRMPVPARERQVRELAAEYGERSLIWKTSTSSAANRVERRSLDFVFVDADHSTEGVLEDIRAWTPKIRPGGGLFGHDIHMETVRQAVERCFGSSYRTADDHVWGVRI